MLGKGCRDDACVAPTEEGQRSEAENRLCVGAKNLSPFPRCRRIEKVKGEGETLPRT